MFRTDDRLEVAGMKTIGVNVVALLALIAGLNLLSTMLLIGFFEASGALGKGAGNDPRATLPNYKGREREIHQYFQDSEKAQIEYVPYVGWRDKPYASATVNIDKLGRRYDPEQPERPALVAFLGGSVVWGTGEVDKNTIPALFTAITGRGALNEGETGFNSRQTLDLLISRTTQGYGVKTVVDFGGVNDVVAGCDLDLAIDATVQDYQMHEIFENDIKYKGVLPDATGHFLPRQNYSRLLLANLMPTAMLAEDARERLRRASASKTAGAGQSVDDLPSRFVCDKDPKRADAVVDTLLLNWSTARMVAEAHGLKFLAVLEPNAYFGQARRDHLSLNRELGVQLVTVYGLLRKKIAALNADWILDMTDVLDGLRDEYVYIDYSHVSVNGNRVIAQAIATRLLASEQSNRRP
jgi:hypothetical protein